MGYIHSVSLTNDQTYLIEPILYAVAGGTTTDLTAAITNFTLVAGVQVSVKVGTVSANATLNVNGTGAKDIYYKTNKVSAGMLTQNNIYTFVYDGSHWVIIGNIPYVNNENLILS